MLINTVKNVIYIVFCFISTIYLSEMELLAAFLLFFAIPVLLEGWLNRYERKGRRKSRKRNYDEAILYFRKSYAFYGRHAWTEVCRRWCWPFRKKNTGQEAAVAQMLLCYLNLGQRSKALECRKELQERWPEGLTGSEDFSFLEVLEDGNYQEFQRENEEQVTAALSGLLNPGEKLELCFYGITDRRGKNGRRWKKRPCFVGLSGSDLFIAVLKRPSMEETAWTERYSLDVRHVKEKVRFSDWCIFEILCVNGDRLRIQCLKMLAANQYAGQEENVRRFEDALRRLEITPNERSI